MMIRIFIADDHNLFRAGLRTLLSTEPDLEIVGEAAHGDEALRLISQLNPDVALLDINMPSPDGLEIIRQLKNSPVKTRSLILTAYEDESLLKEAMKAGAAGYVVKRALGSELVDAVRSVNAGNVYVHPTMTHILLKGLQDSFTSDEVPIEELTRRETEVLSLIAEGYTNRQIGEELGISTRTVEGHRANLMNKLGVHNRLDLIRYAKKQGLI